MCEQVPELLFQREHGQLSPEQAERLEKHLQTCERCKARQDEFARARKTVRELGGGLAGGGARRGGGVSLGQRLAGAALIAISLGAAAWGITRTVTPERIGSAIANLRAAPPMKTADGVDAARPAQTQAPAARVVHSERIPWSEDELGRARVALEAGAYDRRLDPMDGAERDLAWLLPDGRNALGALRIVYLGKQSSVVEFPRKDGRGALRLTLQPLVRHGERVLWFTVLLEEVAPPDTAKP